MRQFQVNAGSRRRRQRHGEVVVHDLALLISYERRLGERFPQFLERYRERAVATRGRFSTRTSAC
jgi:hypothetical protein